MSRRSRSTTPSAAGAGSSTHPVAMPQRSFAAMCVIRTTAGASRAWMWSFHLAALIAIPYSYVAPESYVATNVKGTLNLLPGRACERCARLIHTSTSEVYGTARLRADRRAASAAGAIALHGASKIGADAVAMSFPSRVRSTAHHCPAVQYLWAAAIRARGHPDHHQPVGRRHEAIKLGDPTPTRDFNYVTTPAAPLALAVARGPSARPSISAPHSRFRSVIWLNSLSA